MKAQSRAFKLADYLSDDLMLKSTEISSEMGFQLRKKWQIDKIFQTDFDW